MTDISPKAGRGDLVLTAEAAKARPKINERNKPLERSQSGNDRGRLYVWHNITGVDRLNDRKQRCCKESTAHEYQEILGQDHSD